MRKFWLLAAALVMFAAPAAQAQTQAPKPAAATEPLALVRSFYVAGFNDDKLPLSARLTRLLKAAQANSTKLNGPVEGLDFAWTMGAQDGPPGWEKSARVSELQREANKATIKAVFKIDRPMELHYSLVREGGVWKVDDIAGKGPAKDDKFVLSQMLIRGAKEK